MTVFGNLVQCGLFLCLCTYFLRCYFLPRKLLAWKQIVCYSCCFLFLSVVSVLLDFLWVCVLCAALISGLLCWILYDTNLIRAGFAGLAMGGVQAIATGIGLLLYREVDGLTPSALPILESTAAFMLTLISSLLNDRWRNSCRPVLWLIPVWLVSVLLCEEILRIKNHKDLIGLIILALIWLAYAHMRLLQIGKKVEIQMQKNLRSQQMQRHYALQEEYYQQLLDKQTETRALWHDLNKYLRAAKAESPSSQALSQMEALLDSATEIVDVGNRVLNVILNEYAQIAKTGDIELRLKVQVPEELFVTAADLYVIIGNTMDNALEACKDLPHAHRLIDLTLRMHNDVLYYKLVNPYSTETQHLSKDPKRGYGLQNVRKCIQSYTGNMKITRQNGFFTVFIHLNKP